MLGPFPLAEVIERARAIEGVRIVGGVSDLKEAEDTPPRNTPAIYALSEEKGEPGMGGTGRLIQPMTVTLKLVMWIRHAGASSLAEEAMTTLERRVRQAFFGWRPAAEYKPLRIRNSGADLAIGAHRIRQLLMTTSYPQTTDLNP